MSLLETIRKSGSIKLAEPLSESAFFISKDMIPTKLPILNIAFSGELDGGLTTGITVLAGQSKSFKTLLGLYCLKAYFDKYKDAICLFYDTEFGITPSYLEMYGIDTSRVLHVPTVHVEELKFDIVKRLEAIKKNDRVFIMIDSLGSLASKKEVDDAADEKSVADMTRAKAIRSLLRIITPHITMKDLPCIIINHVYKEMGLFPKDVIPGGTAVTYTANQIFIITKSQIKEGKDIVGYTFTLSVDKSRYVREGTKLKFDATFEDGIDLNSGLFDIAVNGEFVVSPSMGWYSRVDPATGEIEEKKWRRKELDKEFWKPILDSEHFQEYVRKRYMLAHNMKIEQNEIEQFIQESEDE